MTKLHTARTSPALVVQIRELQKGNNAIRRSRSANREEQNMEGVTHHGGSNSFAASIRLACGKVNVSHIH
jgi:hypothetical protein